MAKKHQIWSSNKKTRVKSGRKWRRQAKQWLPAQAQDAINFSKRKRPCSSTGRARKDVSPTLVVTSECPGVDYMPSKHEVASSNLATGSCRPKDIMTMLNGGI